MNSTRRPSSNQIDTLERAYREGRYRDAIALARALVDEFPSSLPAWSIRGVAARSLGELDEAHHAFTMLEQLDPASGGAAFNLALVHSDQGDTEAAIAAYRRALDIDPQLVQALNNLGSVLLGKGETQAAITLIERARALRADWPEVHNSLGNAYRQAKRFDHAAAAYNHALSINPRFAQAQYNLGVLDQERGRLEAACDAFEKTLALQPDHALAHSQLLYLLAQACDWERLALHRGGLEQLGVTGPAVPPFPFFALEDAPDRQLQRSRNWATHNFGSQTGPMPARPKQRPARLRLGYFSGDFHDHPSMHLMAGLLKHHDRNRFEVHAVSYGEQAEDEYRRKARERVEHFHDVAGWSDARIVDLARSKGFDIIIDRKGYTSHTRNNLLQNRLAPVQVNYLAYPGTLGAPFVDYIVGDRIVAPQSTRAHFSEKVITLPHAYQPNDDQRAIAPLRTTRSDFGLPEDAFVLCCFNATYKITAREWAIWMRVLDQIDDAVLWLFRSNDSAPANLRRAASTRGVDPDRLIFADRLPHPEHLARHAHADLFVDTLAMNAHTTASDALWAGLPLVTRTGEQFAARVSTSLLQAVDLGELAVPSDAQYEALTVELARDRNRLSQIRQRLCANRQSAPLFDTAQYTSDFEAGLALAYQRFFDGLPPADIDVATQG